MKTKNSAKKNKKFDIILEKREAMKLIINGEIKEFSENITLEKVLKELG